MSKLDISSENSYGQGMSTSLHESPVLISDLSLHTPTSSLKVSPLYEGRSSEAYLKVTGTEGFPEVKGASDPTLPSAPFSSFCPQIGTTNKSKELGDNFGAVLVTDA